VRSFHQQESILRLEAQMNMYVLLSAYVAIGSDDYNIMDISELILPNHIEKYENQIMMNQRMFSCILRIAYMHSEQQ
jgi:hypothetical protein